jgi:hypothetical protein
METSGRVTELLEELQLSLEEKEQMKERGQDLELKLDSLLDRLESLERVNKELYESKKSDEEVVSVEEVNEMEALFMETIQKLSARVEELERTEETTSMPKQQRSSSRYQQGKVKARSSKSTRLRF